MSLDNLEYSVMLTSLAKKAGEVSVPVTRLASLLVATGLVTAGQLVLAQVYRVYTKPVFNFVIVYRSPTLSPCSPWSTRTSTTASHFWSVPSPSGRADGGKR